MVYSLDPDRQLKSHLIKLFEHTDLFRFSGPGGGRRQDDHTQVNSISYAALPALFMHDGKQ